ncbi:hypothetical protein ABZ924_20560 [Streptomyces sp. NPDC046876]|uniref:hypothetical protein n=1 Tax=Streptomyces sp. NPDC046876 TaxID=3155616 RepID=UPI0033E25B1C
MKDRTIDRTDRHTTLVTVGMVIAAVLVVLSFVALTWWQGWHIPIFVGYLSVKVAIKAVAIAGAGLVALAAWLRNRRNKAADGPDPSTPPDPRENAPTDPS